MARSKAVRDPGLEAVDPCLNLLSISIGSATRSLVLRNPNLR
jgi:hypothetical protein